MCSRCLCKHSYLLFKSSCAIDSLCRVLGGNQQILSLQSACKKMTLYCIYCAVTTWFFFFYMCSFLLLNFYNTKGNLLIFAKHADVYNVFFWNVVIHFLKSFVKFERSITKHTIKGTYIIFAIQHITTYNSELLRIAVCCNAGALENVYEWMVPPYTNALGVLRRELP